MKIVRTVAELRSIRCQYDGENMSVGFVPTMGSFHEGHLSLMRTAREQCDVVIVSLFVNPMQFSGNNAFQDYPRDEERDVAMAEKVGVDAIFAPPAEEMYPKGFASTVSIQGYLVDSLRSVNLVKDTQLTGMCTIIAKLMNIVDPDSVFFGEKDLPHWLAVERMMLDLNMPAEVVVLPTVREADGLAMASRNVHLREHRETASCVPKALRAALDSVERGCRDPQQAKDSALAELSLDGVEVDYIEILNIETMLPVIDLNESAVIAICARVGGVQLVDIARTHSQPTV